jgi:hypothetical protein
MASFYNAADQELYKKFQFLPQEQYRLGLNLPKDAPAAPVPGGGIVNTNAFNNSGGGNDNFNPAGNAFGYGEPVKPGDPSVITSGPYAGQSGYYDSLNYSGGLPGDVSQKGPGRHFTYDNSGKFYKDYSLTPRKEVPGFLKAGAAFVPGGNFLLNKIEDKMNPEGPFTKDDNPYGGSYGIGGMSDEKKAAYNALAGIEGGGLFKGANGFKTLTGKNFNAKNYIQGQLDIYDKKGYDKYTVDEDDDVYDANGKKLTGYLKKQYLEASSMYKTTEKQKKEAEEQKKQEAATKAANDLRFKQEQDRLDGLVGTTVIDRNTGTSSVVQNESGGNDRGTSRRSDHAQAAGLGSNAGNVRAANAAGTGSAQSYNQNLADGGRAGYFFGGRVNYKTGGRINFRGGGMDMGNASNQAQSAAMGNSTSAPGPGDTGGEGGNNPSDNSDTQFGGDNNNGGGGGGSGANDNLIDISTITKSLGNIDIPVGLKALMADKGKLQAVLNADNILDKNLGAEVTYDSGPFNIGAYADMDGNKSLNANYTRNNSKYSFDLNDGGGQLKFTRAFANGGLAGLL